MEKFISKELVMKKTLFSLMAIATLAVANNNTTAPATTVAPKVEKAAQVAQQQVEPTMQQRVNRANVAPRVIDPFEQMEKIFQMQLRQMEQMQKQMDAMFKAFETQSAPMASLPNITSSGGIISSGIVDKGDHYEVTLKANKDSKLNINVEAKNGMLSIQVKEEKEINQKTPFGVVKSFSTSSYMQSFTLPKDADEQNIKYEAKDGKIVVKIPKKK